MEQMLLLVPVAATAIGYNAKVDASFKVKWVVQVFSSIGGQVSWTLFLMADTK